MNSEMGISSLQRQRNEEKALAEQKNTIIISKTS